MYRKKIFRIMSPTTYSKIIKIGKVDGISVITVCIIIYVYIICNISTASL